MKYKIGKNNFKTKKEAENFARNYINKLGCGFTSILDVEPFKFFIDLINNHPNSKDKIGCGIKYIQIQKNRLNKNALETIIVRNDNSTIDFSWLKCSTSSSNSIFDNLKAAMRQFVSVDTQNFKKNSIMKCEFCDCVEFDFHVDHHEPSFKKLVDDFLIINPNHPTNFDDEPKTNIAIFKKDDKDYADIWREYHTKNAKLQILCSDCNLRKSKKIKN